MSAKRTLDQGTTIAPFYLNIGLLIQLTLIFIAISFCTFAQVDLTNGLVAHYPFDGNANDQAGNNHGTIFGSTFTPDRFGSPNQALFFDGNDYVTVPHHTNINFGFDDFSISFWIKTNYSEKQMILQKGGDNGPAVPQYWIRDNDNSPNSFRHLTGDGNPPSPNVLASSANLHDGNWHHVATFRQGALLKMYFDGCLVATDNTDPRNINNNIQLIIGAQNAWGSHGIENFFHGSLDEIRFYNRVLSDQEILELAESRTLTTIYAGDDFETCSEDELLDADIPVVGNGEWKVITGAATIDNVNDPKSIVRQLTDGSNVFEWTVSNSCENLKDTITIDKIPDAEIPNAGEDQILCNSTETYLSAQAPVQATGSWSIVQGNAQFIDINDPNTLATGLNKGNNLFEWTISNKCSSESDQVLIIVEDREVIANLRDTSICNGQSIVLAPGIPEATYLWSSGSTNPTIMVDEAGIYWVEVSTNDCVYTDTILVDYREVNQCEQTLIFHNAFNPKSKITKNRTFHLHNPNSISAFEIRIFDRWGELIFQSSDKNFKWSGYYRGNLSPIGVYAYTVQYSFVETNRSLLNHGLVHLIY